MDNYTQNKDKDTTLNSGGFVTTTDDIASLIKVIRGRQVMLDRDLAALYGVETKRLNEQVKRNIKRFPDDFMFQLNKEECLRSQIATLNEGRGQHLKYMPYAFTENGVAMLSSVLRSDTAIEVNIRIMRAFTSMRQFLLNNAEIFQRISSMEYRQLEILQRQNNTDRQQEETNKRIDEVFRRLDEGIDKPKQGIFYDGQIYDAYTFAASIKDLGKKWFGFSKMEILTPEELVRRITESSNSSRR